MASNLMASFLNKGIRLIVMNRAISSVEKYITGYFFVLNLNYALNGSLILAKFDVPVRSRKSSFYPA